MSLLRFAVRWPWPNLFLSHNLVWEAEENHRVLDLEVDFESRICCVKRMSADELTATFDKKHNYACPIGTVCRVTEYISSGRTTEVKVIMWQDVCRLLGLKFCGMWCIQLGGCFLTFRMTLVPSGYSGPTRIALWKDLVYANTGTAELRFAYFKKKTTGYKGECVAILVYKHDHSLINI